MTPEYRKKWRAVNPKKPAEYMRKYRLKLKTRDRADYKITKGSIFPRLTASAYLKWYNME